MRGFIVGAAVCVPLGLSCAAASAETAPACAPGTLDNSALQDGSVTISPLPGSRDASPQTQISFLGVPAHDITVLSVTGSRTGPHRGRLEAYSQGDGASFLPARPFAEGERVTVRARVSSGGAQQPLLDVFEVATEDRITTTPERVFPGSAAEVQSFVSRPDLRPPTVTVTASSPLDEAGDEFVAPYGGAGQAGPMIVEPDGGLVWFKPLPEHTSATNLQVQEYEGRPVLTWWQGDISVHGFGLGEDVIANGAYEEIATVHAGNGYQADLHEFELTPQGTALITAYNPIICDASAVGGPAYDGVTDSLLQEIDVKTGLVMYEWTSIDHVAMSESYEQAVHSDAPYPYDFFHLNSIQQQPGGGLLISSRNTWTVYQLNARTGQIEWRLGGKHSSFAETSSSQTAWQHDPRALGGGLLSIFDNGSSPTVHRQSRGLVLRVEPQAGEVALVGEVTHTPALVSESQGSVQSLANGDLFVGWGQEPYFSEFGREGALLFDAHFPPHTQSYRAFRFAWTGTPARPPTFAFRAGSPGEGTVFASWNGATQVASWSVLTGPSPGRLTAVAGTARSGFETAVTVPAGSAGPYMTVQALGAAGQVLGTAPLAREAGL